MVESQGGGRNGLFFFFFLDSDLRIAVHYYELRASSGWLEYLAVSILLLFGTLLLMITHADPNDICQG